MLQNNFFRLLRFALGTARECPSMTVNEWQDAYDECERQGVLPLVGKSLETVGGVLKDPTADNRRAFRRILAPWMTAVVVCRDTNKIVSRNAAAASRMFARAGFEGCLLKGQGNAALYPHPEARTPGDIDLWLRRRLTPEEAARERDTEKDVDAVIAFVRKIAPRAKLSYHHMECPPYHGTPLEAHLRPQFLFLPGHNRRLQKYFADNADAQFANTRDIGGGSIAVPTPPFNAVLQLCHIHNHLFYEGVGMRQIIDYYYVMFHLSPDERARDWARLLAPMGLLSACAAVMWILVEALGMPPGLCIVAPDERRGRLVLSEIMAGGNFGQFDRRHHWGRGQVAHNVQRLVRDVRLLRWFPSEAIAEPFFRLWHFGWRLKKNRRSHG